MDMRLGKHQMTQAGNPLPQLSVASASDAGVLLEVEQEMVLAMSAHARDQLALCGRLWALRLYGQELVPRRRRDSAVLQVQSIWQVSAPGKEVTNVLGAIGKHSHMEIMQPTRSQTACNRVSYDQQAAHGG
jgi:hypothetical protein